MRGAQTEMTALLAAAAAIWTTHFCGSVADHLTLLTKDHKPRADNHMPAGNVWNVPFPPEGSETDERRQNRSENVRKCGHQFPTAKKKKKRFYLGKYNMNAAFATNKQSFHHFEH